MGELSTKSSRCTDIRRGHPMARYACVGGGSVWRRGPFPGPSRVPHDTRKPNGNRTCPEHQDSVGACNMARAPLQRELFACVVTRVPATPGLHASVWLLDVEAEGDELTAGT